MGGWRKKSTSQLTGSCRGFISWRDNSGVRFIGQPKQPTLSIYQLIDGEYQVQQFRGKDLISKSLIFPELSLTAEQVFQGQK
jgi:Uma2 family endonuclease